MSEREPDRLEGTSDDALLRDLLASGRKELPEQAQLESVLAKLGPTLGGPGGGGGGGGGAAPVPHAATGLAGLGGAKVLTAVVVLAAAAWGINQAQSHRDRQAPPAAHPPITVAPVADTPEETAPDVAPPAPSASTSAPIAATPSASARPPRPVLPPAQDSELEIKLLQRAQDALFAKPADALKIVDEDVRRFPDGVLRQEAEVIAIDALVRTGQRAPAEVRAKRFRAAYPESTHLRRIETILAAPP